MFKLKTVAAVGLVGILLTGCGWSGMGSDNTGSGSGSPMGSEAGTGSQTGATGMGSSEAGAGTSASAASGGAAASSGSDADAGGGSGTSESGQSVVYTNQKYGFQFTLPADWKGYTIVTSDWKGYAPAPQGDGEALAAKGTEISIRHPKWTKDDPHQDIPIMVLNETQWESLKNGDFHIGAAPIGPSELGHNKYWYFMLPARYNYAFPTGYKEVEQILKDDPLKATQPTLKP